MLGARWGAWAVTLERWLAAAKSIGDRSAEAWALHEIGTAPSVSARRPRLATYWARQSTSGRGCRTTPRRPSQPAQSRARPRARRRLERSGLRRRRWKISRRFRCGTRSRRTYLGACARPRPALPLFFVLVLAIAGGFAYWSPATRESWRSLNASSLGLVFARRRERHGAGPENPSTPVGTRGSQHEIHPSLRSTQESSHRLRIPRRRRSGDVGHSEGECSHLHRASRFHRDGRFDGGLLCRQRRCAGPHRTGRRRRPPDDQLTCRRVAPRQTTTYTLTASGRDGTDVTSQVVIVVR